MPGDVEVARVAGARRFEARVDGEVLGYLSYEERGDGVIDLTHAVVAPAARGRGVGEALARGALAQLREAGARIIPTCPFVAEYLEEHPEDRDLVATGS